MSHLAIAVIAQINKDLYTFGSCSKAIINIQTAKYVYFIKQSQKNLIV